MTVALVDGRCHTPLDSDTGSSPAQAERRNDELLILITGFGFDETCPSCLQAVDEL
jgi:hypothetical protein